MPLIAAALLTLGVVIYGAATLYMSVTPAFGRFAGIAAVLLVALFIGLVAAMLVRRHKGIHGVADNGERVIMLGCTWGQICIDAVQKRGELDLHGKTTTFIFADIASVHAVAQERAWKLELRLRHNDPALWVIPMSTRRQAGRWEKILTLAASQKL